MICRPSAPVEHYKHDLRMFLSMHLQVFLNRQENKYKPENKCVMAASAAVGSGTSMKHILHGHSYGSLFTGQT